VATGGPRETVEQWRLAAVKRYLPLAASAGDALQRITDVAARTFQAPMAMVSFVDASKVTFAAPVGLTLPTTTTDPGLCATAIRHAGPYVLLDARSDPVASRHPMVVAEPWVRFYAAVPIMIDGMPVGTISVMDTEPRSPRSSDVATLRDLAGLAAEALHQRRAATDTISYERAARNRAEADADRLGHLASILQNSLIPTRLPQIAGLEVEVFYLPFTTDDVGGDFFDVFPIDDERWGLFVGDVVGKGVDAASFTSLARYGLRAAALTRPDPASVLSTVNETVRLDPSGDDSLYCTVAYGELTRGHGATWRARIALGGHPPPFIVRATRAVQPVLHGGTVVGAFEGERYASTIVDLHPGDTLVMYSDGLSDLPTAGGWLGHEGIQRALEDHPVRNATEAVELLRTVVTDNDRPLRDDLVILATSVPR
jgi:phosphoserine phosphatase RsbU/P